MAKAGVARDEADKAGRFGMGSDFLGLWSSSIFDTSHVYHNRNNLQERAYPFNSPRWYSSAS